MPGCLTIIDEKGKVKFFRTFEDRSDKSIADTSENGLVVLRFSGDLSISCYRMQQILFSTFINYIDFFNKTSQIFYNEQYESRIPEFFYSCNDEYSIPVYFDTVEYLNFVQKNNKILCSHVHGFLKYGCFSNLCSTITIIVFSTKSLRFNDLCTIISEKKYNHLFSILAKKEEQDIIKYSTEIPFTPILVSCAPELIDKRLLRLNYTIEKKIIGVNHIKNIKIKIPFEIQIVSYKSSLNVVSKLNVVENTLYLTSDIKNDTMFDVYIEFVQEYNENEITSFVEFEIKNYVSTDFKVQKIETRDSTIQSYTRYTMLVSNYEVINTLKKNFN